MKYGLLNDRRGKISNFFEKREQETEVSSLTKFNRNVFFSLPYITESACIEKKTIK